MMDDAGLFDATVPVLRHYTQRVHEILSALPDGPDMPLQRRLAPHAFCAAEHLDTALGFVARTVDPLLGRQSAGDGDRAPDRATLIASCAEARTVLASLTLADFEGAAARTVRHTAGVAELEQDATTFATLFALPNFFFHLCMAFAILRYEGIDIGKSDFDGQHAYTVGFHF